jgi:hypothetical protein
MNEEKFCRYGCGMRIKWISSHKMPIEISPSSLDNKDIEPVVVIEHTFKRCTNIQKAQGRKPYFDRASQTSFYRRGGHI